MQSFKKVSAQGEITVFRIGKVKTVDASKFSPLALDRGEYVIGHSETGHNHVLERTDGAEVYVAKTAPEGMRILRAILTEPNALVHMRDHDTHETIVLAPGVYDFHISREYDPYAELARTVAD